MEKQECARLTAVVRLVGERMSNPSGRMALAEAVLQRRRASSWRPSRGTRGLGRGRCARRPGRQVARSTVQGCSSPCSATHTLTMTRWTRSSALRTPAESTSSGRSGTPRPGVRRAADARVLHGGAAGQSRVRRDRIGRSRPVRGPGSPGLRSLEAGARAAVRHGPPVAAIRASRRRAATAAGGPGPVHRLRADRRVVRQGPEGNPRAARPGQAALRSVLLLHVAKRRLPAAKVTKRRAVKTLKRAAALDPRAERQGLRGGSGGSSHRTWPRRSA
jgi:hypothetical protein